MMTFNTNRNNIKPMCRFVSVPVVILLCRLRTIMTEQKFRRNQAAHTAVGLSYYNEQILFCNKKTSYISEV